MAKGFKGFANPAAPKKAMTSHEAEAALTAQEPEDNENTIDSEEDTEAESDQDIIDDVFGADGEEGEDDDQGEPDEDDDTEVTDLPTKPATKVVAKGGKGSNLSPEQQKYWDEVGKLGTAQGHGVSSLISLAEKCVAIGANGIFETTQLKDLYLHFRKNSNSAAGKNAEVGENDHTVVSNTSKLRTFYKIGERFGPDGWGKMLKVARDIHVQILRSKDERKLLRSKQLVPTYEALVKVGQVQNKKEKDAKGVAQEVYPQLLTADQIKDVYIDINKKESEPTVLDVINAAAKAIERVIRGKVNPDTGEQSRDSFEHPKDAPDDNSVNAALDASLNWVLTAGERYKEGFIANREKEQAEAKKLAEERKQKHNERIEREEKERLAKKAKKEQEKKDKEAAAALAKEQAAA